MLIATTNLGKLREFREMLAPLGITISDLSSLSPGPDVAEIGHTFRANACLKAAAYAQRARQWALADDSGLAVDALEGKPGVHSARWAAMHDAGGGDAANNALLLKQMENVPDERRTARFVCVLALADPDGKIVFTTEGTVAGQLLRRPRGANGFGYDPLFLVPSLDKTTAELSPAEKHEISHRGQALKRMKQLLQEHDLIAADTRWASFMSRVTARYHRKTVFRPMEEELLLCNRGNLFSHEASKIISAIKRQWRRQCQAENFFSHW